MKVWAAKFLRDTRVVICAENFFCNKHEGVLVPQPKENSRQDSYLPSHPSFHRIDVPDSLLATMGIEVPKPHEPAVVVPKENNRNLYSELNAMSRDELKSMAKSLNIVVGNSGRDRLIEKITLALREGD